jgi:outer membrane protein assembly factor BamB
VYSSSAVANGVVYVGSSDGSVYALNASTGAKLWSYLTGLYPIRSSPAVANGVVYVGSYDGNVYALSASTGAKLWSYTTGTQVQTSPAVANGVVYFGSGGYGVGTVYALNASTGAKLWSYATGGFVYSSPAVANGVVYIGSEDFNVYALNASTGAKLWSYDTGDKIESSPAVANGVVYVGTRTPDGVTALNASTGGLLGSYAGEGDSSPAVVNGTIYIGATAYSLGSADLYLRITPTTTTVHQGDLITYAFPVWNLGPDNADLEVLNTQVPEGTVFDYIRISGTPGLGTCSYTPYLGAGPIPIVCHENSVMALNTTWTVRLTVKVTAPADTVITENAATMASTPDPNMANNTATVSLTVVP